VAISPKTERSAIPSTVTASVMIADLNSRGKVRCHTVGVENIVRQRKSPSVASMRRHPHLVRRSGTREIYRADEKNEKPLAAVSANTVDLTRFLHVVRQEHAASGLLRGTQNQPSQKEKPCRRCRSMAAGMALAPQTLELINTALGVVSAGHRLQIVADQLIGALPQRFSLLSGGGRRVARRCRA